MPDLGDLFDGIGTTRELGPRGQRIVRFVFGLLLAIVAAVGVWHMILGAEGGVAMRAAGAAMFGALALFGIFGIGLGRGVAGLGCLFLASVGALFVVRIVFGP